MKKIFTLITLMVLVTSSLIFSQQWVNTGSFPPATPTLFGNVHGVAIDPDGKIWVGDYYNLPGDSIFNGTATVATRAIHVYNPDGSEVSFSPILTITVGGVTDSLVGMTNRGMRTAQDGNILVSIYDRLYKIDYQTGQGIAKVVPKAGSSLTAAAVDTAGNVYVATVVPGNPIFIYTPDLSTSLGQVTDKSVGFSRSFEVSADGNKVYWAGYDKHDVKIYSRPDEYGTYTLTDSVLFGFDCESFTWSPDRSVLWASSGSYNDKPNRDPDTLTYWSVGTWYAWDPTSNQMVDSIKTTFPVAADPNYRPRGLAFSSDYQTAYAAYFGGTKPSLVKFEKMTITSVNVTFRANMSVQIQKGAFEIGVDTVEVRGSFQTAAGDPGGNWQGFYFTMTKGANDSIYSVTATFPGSEVGKTFAYKLVINGGGWESASDRPFQVPYTNTLLPVVFYSNESVYVHAVKNIVQFQADMSSYLGTAPGQFNPSTDSLVVMGLSNWGGYVVTEVVGNRTLHASFSDPNIYTTTLTFYGPVGDSTGWKFKAYPDVRFGNGGGYEVGENRYYHFVSDTINTNVLPPVVPVLVIYAGSLASSVDILFQVNMSNAVDYHSKVTIPTTDITFVGLKGGIKPLGNWAGTWTYQDTVDAPTYVDTISTLKTLNDQGLNGDKVAGDNIWSLLKTMPAGTPAGTFEFKFAMGYAGVENENQGGTYLDNEMATNVNHSMMLQDGPAVEILFNFGVQAPVGVEVENNITPKTYALSQNYPNPFNPATTIKYSVPSAQFVTLKIYNLLGQEVVTLINQEQNAGNYIVRFDASGLSSGIYFYSLQAGNFNETRKMMLMK